MKALIILVLLTSTAVSFAKEVDTECSAMNENREKIVKTAKPKVKTVKGSSQQ